jgi:hypothetical protein
MNNQNSLKLDTSNIGLFLSNKKNDMNSGATKFLIDSLLSTDQTSTVNSAAAAAAAAALLHQQMVSNMCSNNEQLMKLINQNILSALNNTKANVNKFSFKFIKKIYKFFNFIKIEN